MAYANVKCEDCGLIMPQNEATAVQINAESVATNNVSFGLSGNNLRQWKQGDRTYTRTKRIFFCSNCYENYQMSVATLPASKQPSNIQLFFKMLLWNKLYQVFRGACRELFG